MSEIDLLLISITVGGSTLVIGFFLGSYWTNLRNKKSNPSQSNLQDQSIEELVAELNQRQRNRKRRHQNE